MLSLPSQEFDMSQQVIPCKKHNLELITRYNMNSSLERTSSSNPFLIDKISSNLYTDRGPKNSREFFNYKPGGSTSEAIMKKLKKSKMQNVKLRFINLDQSSESKTARREHSFECKTDKPVSPLRYIPPEEKNRGKEAQNFREILKKSRGNRSASENRTQENDLKPYKYKLNNNTRIEIIQKNKNVADLLKSPIKQIDLSSKIYQNESILNKQGNYNKYLNRKTAIAHIDFSCVSPTKSEEHLQIFESNVAINQPPLIQATSTRHFGNNEVLKLVNSYKRSNSRSQPGQNKMRVTRSMRNSNNIKFGIANCFNPMSRQNQS